VAAKVLDNFETLLLDLDGVIYEGGRAIVNSVESITALRGKWRSSWLCHEQRLENQQSDC
jgi:ribonucleotide monophosphatase NagD (HAD superfamily)